MEQKLCLVPGTLLDENYQIIRLIGQGGMGSVYMAYDTRLDIKVAIKVISPEFSKTMDDPQFESVLKRFESEAKISAKIDHPNVIRIFGFKRENIVLDDRRHDTEYLVMEHLAGRTLRNTMDVSGFEYEEEIKAWIDKYLIPILNGLRKVHEGGIIHRDIKPENFLMKEDVPKLADFGLSLGFDLPPVTGSVADIFGTVTYMAPEQFYNFSMARETADIYSIGKILYEVVEGKLSDKTKPLKQAELSNPETDFLKALNRVITAATEENPNLRIGSANELKDRLIQLLYCKGGNLEQTVKRPPRSLKKKFIWPVVVATAIAVGAVVMYHMHNSQPIAPQAEIQTPKPGELESVRYIPHADTLKKKLRSKDNSILLLIPPAVLKLAEDNFLGLRKIMVKPLYLSESPVTNQQYVSFLNEIINRLKVKDSDVYLDDRLVLKLSEKIRGYKPIIFDDGHFIVKDPMHSASAVLFVTGLGAKAYVHHYGMRLPRAPEWFYVMLTGNNTSDVRMPLPNPVINFEQNKYGLRGINQVAEWGQTKAGEFVIFGQTPSSMIEGDLVSEKSPFKYYTDTSFRVAKDAN